MFDSLLQVLQHCRADRVVCVNVYRQCMSYGSLNLAVETYTAHLGPVRLVVLVSDITFSENSVCTCTKMSAGFVLLPSTTFLYYCLPSIEG